jgi:predicted RNA-binding Zn-ribbon protein involved in translation (DUF1610 family)
MAIIWGGGAKIKNSEHLWVPYLCNRCDGSRAFLVIENYKYGHVYGIRIAKYKAKYFLMCSTCELMLPILSKDKFLLAQGIARRVKVEPADSSRVMQQVLEVARGVLGDFDLANAIQQTLARDLSDEAGANSNSNSNREVTTMSREPAWYLSENLDVTNGAMLPEAARGDTEQKVCPDCGEEVRAIARKCRFCGYQFNSEL